MNRLLTCLLVATLATPAALSAAQFEGKVSFKMTSSRGQPQEMVYSIKGDKLRLEMPGQPGAMGGIIIDTTKKETTIVMDAQKMYMVQAMPEAASPAANKKSGEAATLEKTGEKEKILGYPAEKYISTSDGNKTELWLAEGLGTFMGPGNPMGGGRRGGRGAGGGTQAWERLLAGKELFPLRVVGTDQKGTETFRMEATAIEKQSLPDSLFAPPAGYEKFDMGGMMRGMMPGGRPPGSG